MAKRKTKKNKNGKVKTAFRYPKKLLDPVGKMLQGNLKKLEKRKKDIEQEDPFSDESRVTNNASPDTDAQEQYGHARTSAIKEQLDRKIVQTKKALSKVKVGSYGVCEVCGELIDTDRLMIYPEAILCAKDAKKIEAKN